MATGREYFIEDRRFTPSEFRRLSKARQIEAMVQWFQSRYQDPAHETPYNGREGGYLWVHGGPYDADTELQEEFSELTEFETIQRAVEEVTSDGIYEWAPIRRDGAPEEDDDGFYSLDQPLPDINDLIDEEEDQLFWPELPPGQAYLTDERGKVLTDQFSNPLVVNVPDAVGQPPLNTSVVNGPAVQTPPPDPAVVASLRREMNRRFDELEAIIQRHMAEAPNRGHNEPPELLEIERHLTVTEAEEITASVAIIREESDKHSPDIERVVSQVGTLRRILRTLGTLAVLGTGYVVTEVASLEIGILHNNHRQDVIDALTRSIDSVAAWVSAIAPIF